MNRRRRLVSRFWSTATIVAWMFVVACGESNGSAPSDAGEAGAGDPGLDGGTSDANSPTAQQDAGRIPLEIMSLTAKPDTLHQVYVPAHKNETVTLTAVINLPNLPDGTHGFVRDQDPKSHLETYGYFSKTAEPGVYTATINWDRINEVNAINTGKGGARRFVAFFPREYDGRDRFYATKTIDIKFECENNLGVCSGGCYETDYDNSFCGNSCSGCSFPDRACSGGTCQVRRPTECIEVRTGDAPTTCNAACAKRGRQCLPIAASGDARRTYAGSIYGGSGCELSGPSQATVGCADPIGKAGSYACQCT